MWFVFFNICVIFFSLTLEKSSIIGYKITNYTDALLHFDWKTVGGVGEKLQKFGGE